MPSSRDILESLTAIANGWPTAAIGWHVGLGALLLGLLVWRPAVRSIALLLVLPLISVSLLAWAAGNPFNGAAFAVLSVVLGWCARRLPLDPVRISSPWMASAGAALVGFGWVYPHFLASDSWLTYLYAAPLGLIPCPTLSAVVGVALILDGLGSRAWSITLAVAGLGYGLIGALWLRVTIDMFLLAGAVVLAAAGGPDASPRLSALGSRFSRLSALGFRLWNG